MRAAIIALAVVLCGGCATEGMSILIGESHNYAPTNPESIAILLTAPDQPHEVIALVEGVAATDDYWGSETRTQQAAIDAMRKEAARLGSKCDRSDGQGIGAVCPGCSRECLRFGQRLRGRQFGPRFRPLLVNHNDAGFPENTGAGNRRLVRQRGLIQPWWKPFWQ